MVPADVCLRRAAAVAGGGAQNAWRPRKVRREAARGDATGLASSDDGVRAKAQKRGAARTGPPRAEGVCTPTDKMVALVQASVDEER